MTFETALVDSLPDAPCIIATGPLTDPALTKALSALPGLRELHFFDAAAPIVTAESIDMEKVFRASRYEKGSDYLNCPMDEAEYNAFYDALVGAELAEVHDFEKKLVFEGCLAVEILASAGGRRWPSARSSPWASSIRIRAASHTPWYSCGRRTSRARSTASSASRRGSNGASRSACFR